MEIGLQKSLVGVIEFSNTAVLRFGVTQYPNEADLLVAINNLPYRGQNTNTAAALNLLRITSRPGGRMNLRKGFPHIAILVTDGQSGNPDATRVAAAALHADGNYNQVYAVGMSGADQDELKVIADDPSHVLFTPSFGREAIEALVKNITQQLEPCTRKLHRSK